ncbi:MAG: DUF975 family protein [Ruminococcaceae bacterium]|nr:DUF975 family protein [Oscillospiraceae bacterium]
MEKIAALKEEAKKIFLPFYIYCLIIIMINYAVTSLQQGLISYGIAAFKLPGQYMMLQFVIIISFLIGFFIVIPMEVGVKGFFLNLTRGEAEIKDIVSPFKKAYDRAVIILFLRNIKVILWSVLLIVPGIYKLYEYAMLPYIIADEPNISNKEAFARSKKIMTGNRMKLFKLQISFIGWYILSAITLSIGFVFLAPYTHTAEALFYEQIKDK